MLWASKVCASSRGPQTSPHATQAYLEYERESYSITEAILAQTLPYRVVNWVSDSGWILGLTCAISVQNSAEDILFHIGMMTSHSWCKLAGCTSTMWILCSTISHSCSIGLKSGDRGGHFNTMNWLSCSRDQFEMIWALWHDILYCWKHPSEE